MATLEEVIEHLHKYPMPELEGKLIPADVLVGYLFLEHDHDPRTEVAIVPSMELEDFIRAYPRET